jgi:hypothetical protein
MFYWNQNNRFRQLKPFMRHGFSVYDIASWINSPIFSKKQLGYYSQQSKGKAVPLQAWSGPEGSRKFRFPDYMTTTQDGGEFVSLTHRPPLPPTNAPGIHFC